jgi:hypothetical protein
VRLRHARSISAANLAGRGLSLTFELDEPAGVTVALRGPGGRTIARRATTVAVRGRVRLRLKPSARVGRTLRRRTRSLRTQVVVTVRDRAGNQRTLRRRVTVRPARRRRRTGRR